jgi:hypothetical protein
MLDRIQGVEWSPAPGRVRMLGMSEVRRELEAPFAMSFREVLYRREIPKKWSGPSLSPVSASFGAAVPMSRL